MKTTTPSSSSSPPSAPSNWAWLPHTALLLVLNKLLLLSDMIKFTSVCTNWRYVAKDRLRRLNLRPNMPLHRNLPFLLISSTQGNDSARSLYSINQGEIFDLNLRVPFKKRCCGSSYGWLIILDDDSFEINLINPFYFGNSKGIIRLPQFSAAFDLYAEYGQAFRSEYYISKAILSSDPISSANEFVLMVIYGEMRQLAFWKPGAENWTHINWVFYGLVDVIYAQGSFLAVDRFGTVHSIDTNVADLPYKISTLRVSLLPLLSGWTRRYLVELPDRTILQVLRTLKKCMCCMNCSIQNTTGFYFYKMPVDGDRRSDWSEVSSLVDGALFLGDNHSHYVSASQFPGCRANAVYFIDDYYNSNAIIENPNNFVGPFDIGVYLLEERRVERFSIPILEEFHFPPPLWILPTI